MVERSYKPVVIAGTHKAGTTSVYTYATDHPDILGSLRKETHYFSRLVEEGKHFDEEEWLRFFANAKGEKFYLEASPEYLYGGKSLATRLQRAFADVKIVVIIRDPAEKVVSNYKHRKKMLEVPEGTSLEEFVGREKHQRRHFGVTFVDEGKYHVFLREWFDIFGGDMRVMFFDDLVNNPRGFMNGFCRFVGADPGHFDRYKFTVENKSQGVRFKGLHKALLKTYFQHEGIFRRHRWLSQMLRGLYWSVNAKSIGGKEEVPGWLKAEYERANRELAVLLRDRQELGVLPEWLQKET